MKRLRRFSHQKSVRKGRNDRFEAFLGTLKGEREQMNLLMYVLLFELIFHLLNENRRKRILNIPFLF